MATTKPWDIVNDDIAEADHRLTAIRQLMKQINGVQQQVRKRLEEFNAWYIQLALGSYEVELQTMLDDAFGSGCTEFFGATGETIGTVLQTGRRGDVESIDLIDNGANGEVHLNYYAGQWTSGDSGNMWNIGDVIVLSGTDGDDGSYTVATATFASDMTTITITGKNWSITPRNGLTGVKFWKTTTA